MNHETWICQALLQDVGAPECHDMTVEWLWCLPAAEGFLMLTAERDAACLNGLTQTSLAVWV